MLCILKNNFLYSIKKNISRHAKGRRDARRLNYWTIVRDFMFPWECFGELGYADDYTNQLNKNSSKYIGIICWRSLFDWNRFADFWNRITYFAKEITYLSGIKPLSRIDKLFPTFAYVIAQLFLAYFPTVNWIGFSQAIEFIHQYNFLLLLSK